MEIYGCQFLKTKAKVEDKVSQVLGIEADLFQKDKKYIEYTYFYSRIMAVHTLYLEKFMLKAGKKLIFSFLSQLRLNCEFSLSMISCFSS